MTLCARYLSTSEIPMAHQKGIAKIEESLDMVGKSQSVCILVLERNLCCEESQPPRAAGNGPGQTRKPSLVAQELSKASSPSLPPLDIKYQVVQSLGREGGGFNAGIEVVRRRVDGLICVRKNLVLRPHSTPHHWQMEANMMSRLSGHRNICTLIEEYILLERAELYIEYCGKGTLHDFATYMKNQNIQVPESFVWHMLFGIVEALGWMHGGFVSGYEMFHANVLCLQGWLPVVHRDIKPDNCFLQFSPYGPLGYPTVKLGDFGLAIHAGDLSGLTESSARLCAPGWYAPEHPNCSEFSDVYRAATVAQFLCLPDGNVGIARQLPGNYSVGLNNCIRLGMEENVLNRPLAATFYRIMHSRTDVSGDWITVPPQAFKDLGV
ncbi:NEK protein kinase [Paracoccidioides brasiliensis]|uniref:non-specific serine/threonine protein kinase n=1 Tax=Paracoccidioides brasiliensis TaxID=121759 RepID=A0A1D2J984_PARBR|nr:NEK protein kinase [Paracoccidioides brasiliensis]